MAGIQRLIAECGEPYTVGLALAGEEPGVAEDWSGWIIRHGGDFQPASPMSLCIGGLLRALPEPLTQTTLRAVLEYAAHDNW